MSALIYAQTIQKSYGAKRLFQGVTFGISDRDRIGLIGPNGAGKSTFLKILAGLEKPDIGTVTRRQHLRMAYIPQQHDFCDEDLVGDVLHRRAHVAGVAADDIQTRLYKIAGRGGFVDLHQPLGILSGGWKKRLAIACGLMEDPDVVLLDEPTNHLDLEGLKWLEQLLVQASWSWVMVSHDRWFLNQTVGKVAELHHRYVDGLLMCDGSYSRFLEKCGAVQQAQVQQAQALAGKVRREEAWLRRGPKARTSKAKYRVEKAHALRDELVETEVRLRQQDVSIDFVGSGRKTTQLIEVKDVRKAFGAQVILQQVNMMISPGKAIGVLGHNGSGKSTLLKILAKELDVDKGTIRYADNLQVVYFDQHRRHLDPKVSLRRVLSDTEHTVTYRDQTLHVAGWAKRFGFRPEQLDLPVECLSGGEQARAVMARLMLQPADVLIVDEPTNDLDIQTRETLEENFREFPGALILVTHDRYMLEEVCTEFLGLDGHGAYGNFATYEQWETWLVGRQSSKPVSVMASTRNGVRRESKPQKLSFHEQREYEAIEERILEIEAVRDVCRATIDDPVLATDHVRLQEAVEALQEAERNVEQLYARWAELDAKCQAYREHT